MLACLTNVAPGRSANQITVFTSNLIIQIWFLLQSDLLNTRVIIMFFSHIFDSDHDAIYIVLELLDLKMLTKCFVYW